MPDIVDRATRSRMMSGVRNRDTKLEIIIRRALHALGYRYRLYVKGLPGKPDMVFPKRKAVIFVNGCFWHGHGCHLFRWPATRAQWWKEKIEANRVRDVEVAAGLSLAGWRAARVWECSLKGTQKRALPEVVATLSEWLEHGKADLHIQGKNSDLGLG